MKKLRGAQSMVRAGVAALLAAAFIAIAPPRASADPPRQWRTGGEWRSNDHDYHRDRDRRYAEPHWRRGVDVDVSWHSGHWYHGSHRGRVAWWWIAGGLWYAFEHPVYPYPDPYTPPVVVVQAPPPVVVQPSTPPPPPTQQYWYYCPSERAYYPYVAQCPGGWLQVVPQSSPYSPQ